MSDSLVIDRSDIYVVTVGEQGPQGPAGVGTGGGAGVFITDVTATGTGIVASKTYKPAVPSNANLDTCVSDTTAVRVYVGCNGGTAAYSPTVDINGTTVVLTESSTKRWFTGYADLVLTAGATNLITATSSEGDTDTAQVTVAGAGPNVLSVTFGAYPGSQTELKMGDTIGVTITTDLDATQVQVLVAGANGTLQNLNVTAGTATGTLTISGLSGAQSIQVKARNAFGTYGNMFTSTTLVLNQTYPNITGFTVTYPVGQTAFKNGETADVASTVTSFDTISYSGTGFTIPTPSVYEATKTVTCTSNGYVASGTNYTISATRSANNATSTASTLVKIATAAPTAAITIVGNPARLVGSPTGISYEVRITPDQTVNTAPSLSASLGTWSGSWTQVGAYWKRNLVISDATTKGSGVFSGLSLTNGANVAGSTITSGSTYVVGGFSLRTVTFPAFSRVAPLGVSVSDETKTSAQITGGNVLVRHTDNGVYANGYYIANSDGTYNTNGAYLGLSDSVFAGANTSGTLTADVQEIA